MSNLFCRAKNSWREYDLFPSYLMELAVFMTGVLSAVSVLSSSMAGNGRMPHVGWGSHKRSMTALYAGAGRACSTASLQPLSDWAQASTYYDRCNTPQNTAKRIVEQQGY